MLDNARGSGIVEYKRMASLGGWRVTVKYVIQRRRGMFGAWRDLPGCSYESAVLANVEFAKLEASKSGLPVGDAFRMVRRGVMSDTFIDELQMFVC